MVFFFLHPTLRPLFDSEFATDFFDQNVRHCKMAPKTRPINPPIDWEKKKEKKERRRRRKEGEEEGEEEEEEEEEEGKEGKEEEEKEEEIMGAAAMDC